MSYTVLYRQFRPKTFDEIIGQDQIVSILKNQIKNDSISHAYLFTGIRGTGKTSTAKVFAKAICCLNNKDGNACNECRSCKDINEGGSSDIIEIDAASNRGIDEIRNLKENVNYMPGFGRYKVYIIDEVHMLTPEAFNALLKTLEEPPAHVVFIFATTEANRILPTILSRCQRFDFARIDSKAVVQHMSKILDGKNISYDSEALEQIALKTEGAMRDALSLLDKAIAVTTDGNITVEIVNQILGLISDEEICSVAEGILEKDVDKALTAVHSFLNKGKEVGNIITQLIEYYSDKIIAINVSNPENMIDKGNEYIQSLLNDYCTKEDSNRISDIVYELSKLKNDMRFFNDPEFLFTAKIISLCKEEIIVREGSNVINNYGESENEQIDILRDRVKALERELNELRNLRDEIEEIKNIDFSKINSSGKKQKSKKKDKIKTLQAKESVIEVDRDKIKEAEKLFETTKKYVENSSRDHLVSESVKKFRVVDFENDVLTIYPSVALNMMDIYKENKGPEILKRALKVKFGRPIEVVYIENKVKVVLMGEVEQPKNSLKSFKKNLRNDKKIEIKETFETYEKEEDLNMQSLESMANIDEIMGDKQEEFVSDDDLNFLNENEEGFAFDEAIMSIFNAKEE